MKRIIVCTALAIFLAGCVQSVPDVPTLTPSPIASPQPTSTLIPPSATAALSPTATLTVAPVCNPIKIMPLGDSITYGDGILSYGGYRNLLGALLESDGVSFDFVGSQKSGEESLADPDNEGHSGWRIANIREAIDTEGWLETYQPDLILLHIGTNDLLETGPNHERYENLANITNTLSALLDDILTRLPNTHIIVAQIIRTRWGSDSNHVSYNAAIPGIVASKGNRVSLVDMQDILYKSDFVTLYHPNPKGYDKMAHAWESAILKLGLGSCAVR